MEQIDWGKLGLLAFYLPIGILSALALYLYTRALIWPALKSRNLSIKDHGLALALVAGFFGDVIENGYYGFIRIWNSLHGIIHYTLSPIFGIKMAILSTSVIALAAYNSIVEGRRTLRFWIMFAAGMWAIAFLILVLMTVLEV